MPSLLIHNPTTSPPNSVLIKKPFHLHRQSNRRLPILTIYPDLLEHIFILSLSSEDTTRQHQRTVLSYSQTCHDWRLVAISIKSLWAALLDFELNSDAWNQELLRRSHPSPIVIGSTSHTLRHSRVISAELAHLDRIRSYQVGFDTPSAWDILLERLQHPAPHIEHLNLNHVNYRSIDSFILPSTLFAGDAPCLKRLEITQCLVDFEAPVLRSLTMLSVGYLNASLAPTPLEWLEHLTHLPSLTSLRLANSMRSGGPSILNTEQVKLPLLSALDLDASLHDTHIFIDGLNFPLSCALFISCSECYPGPELDTILLAYLHRLIYTHDSHPDNCPFVIRARRSRLVIWNGSSEDVSSPIDPPILCLDLYLNLNFGFEIWESLLTPVLHILGDAFPNFTSLDLQLPATHPSLLPSLLRATRLTQLTNVSAFITKHLLSDMMQQVILHHLGPSRHIPLPALRTIVFRDDESMWGAPYQAFVAFLAWRRNVGCPVGRVVFRKCMVLDDTVEDLASLGVQVECDSEGLRWQRL